MRNTMYTVSLSSNTDTTRGTFPKHPTSKEGGKEDGKGDGAANKTYLSNARRPQ